MPETAFLQAKRNYFRPTFKRKDVASHRDTSRKSFDSIINNFLELKMKKIIFFAVFMLTTVFSMPLFAVFSGSAVNGDVIVTDSETNLIWQKTYADYIMTWQQALNYCATSTYAGYTDWRLPNKNELASLMNYEKSDPVSDFPDMPSKYFWSSTTNTSNDTNSAWHVAFGSGGVGLSDKISCYYVRCVRN